MGVEGGVGHTAKYTITWFAFFCLIPCSLLPLWKPLTDWALGNAVVKIPDLHFGNAVYLDLSRHVYPLIYSYIGDRLLSSLACIPILMADLLATLLFGSFLFHLTFKYVLGGEGSFKDALAVIAFGNLPSLLFGYLPYSAAVGLAWTSPPNPGGVSLRLRDPVEPGAHAICNVDVIRLHLLGDHGDGQPQRVRGPNTEGTVSAIGLFGTHAPQSIPFPSSQR